MYTITKEEYNNLITRLQFYDTARNKLLVFSFTAVMTILGVSLQITMNTVSVYICLIPYLLIIPFSARIVYYRIAAAQIGAFLCVCAQEYSQFSIGTKTVREDSAKMYTPIAWLVNHEMTLLGVATGIVYYLKLYDVTSQWNFATYASLLMPIAAVVFIYKLQHSTEKYSDISDHFEEEWKQYKSNRSK